MDDDISKAKCKYHAPHIRISDIFVWNERQPWSVGATIERTHKLQSS
jgi:hypothetical protein